MDELFSLAAVRDHARSGDYDVIVVDCAPTAETLRLLSLPEVMSWYMEKMFPVSRRVAKVVRPVMNRVSTMPIANDKVFAAVERFYERLDGIRELLSDPEVTTARLVMNPEKMVIAEARRTYTYLGLFGYGVDAAIVNRVLPDVVSDPYFSEWRDVQKGHLEMVDEAFNGIDVRRLRLFDQEMVGQARLRIVGQELYGDDDPTDRLSAVRPIRIEEVEGTDDVALVLSIPLADRDHVDVMRHDDELFVTVDTYRRSLLLPDSLRRRTITRAKLEDGELSLGSGGRFCRASSIGLQQPAASPAVADEVQAVVDGESIQPRRRRRLTPKPPAVAQCLHKNLLNGVAGSLLVAQQGPRATQHCRTVL
jgi:arsenite-transporting ATPase